MKTPPVDELRKLRSRGLSYRAIGRMFGVSKQAIEQRLHPRPRPPRVRVYRGRGIVWPPSNEPAWAVR